MKEVDWKAEALTEVLRADEPRRIAEAILIDRHTGRGMGRRSQGQKIRSREEEKKRSRREEEVDKWTWLERAEGKGKRQVQGCKVWVPLWLAARPLVVLVCVPGPDVAGGREQKKNRRRPGEGALPGGTPPLQPNLISQQIPARKYQSLQRSRLHVRKVEQRL